jgi:hypothetical protein
MRQLNVRNNGCNRERGIALIMALLALLLISAVGLGMIYMSSAETAINGNYKDTQVAFFAMRGGLEEMRDRLRSNARTPLNTAPNVLPTTAMPGTPNSMIYIVNSSGAGDPVDPKTFANNPYFDDEFCHEYFNGSGVAWVAPGTPCQAVGAPPAGSIEPYIVSDDPHTGTASSLKYKWVRLTLKQNATSGNPLVPATWVDSTQLANAQVCWDATNLMERPSTAMGGAATCDLVTTNQVEPVYLVTAMAVTPSGSRRVGQYEVSAFNMSPPPAGLSLDGPAPNFGTPNSNNASVNGTDQSGTPPAVPNGCSTNFGNQPAIGTDNAADAASVLAQTKRPANFTGTTPAITDQGPALTNWNTPAELNAIVSEMSDVADVTCPGSPKCSLSTYGTVAAPQITFVNGDFSMSGATGSGILVVTGTLTISGVMQWNGLILVIGDGSMVVNGAGDGTVYGEIFVANTHGAGGTLGSPSFNWNGGGKAVVYYNSCWAGLGNNLHYIVLASREEMY